MQPTRDGTAVGGVLSKAPLLPEPYLRRCRRLGPWGEVLVARWRPRVRCAPHDHGGARGLVLLLRGRFLERRFLFDGCSLRVAETREYRAPAIVAVERTDIHDVVAPDGGLSLHFYYPSAPWLRVFDSLARETITVAGTGAWIPVQSRFVVSREPWAAQPAEAS